MNNVIKKLEQKLLASLLVGCFSFVWLCSSSLAFTSQKIIFVAKSDILQDSLDIIDQSYFDHNLIDYSNMLKAALNGISQNVPPVLPILEDDSNISKAIVKVGLHEKTFDNIKLKSLEDLNNILQEIIIFIKQNLESSDLENLREIDYSAINGLLSSLDPHSNLLTPQIYQDFTADSQGTYAGVGMVIRVQDGNIGVIAVIGDNSPAAKAGIEAGDKILQIDKDNTTGMGVEDAKNRLRGPKKTSVQVLIKRSGVEELLTFTLIRDNIKLSSVKQHSFDIDSKTAIGYIKINRVVSDSSNELLENLLTLGIDLKNFKGLILDLRNNPGGLLNQAIDISNKFLEKGVIVSIAGPGKRDIINYSAKPFATVRKVPLVVLVNRFSASAAEIIAGAIQKNKRGIVIGERTFGKGTVQSLVERFNDGSGLKLTTSQYLTPGEHSIQLVGIVPEVLLIPAFIEDRFMQIAPVNSSLENELDNRLSLAKDQKNDTSLYKLNYLEEDSAENKEAEDLSEYGKLDISKLEKDFWITSAIEIIKNTQSESYSDLVKSAETYINSQKLTQQKNISKKLASLDVSWENGSLGSKNLKKSLVASVEIKQEIAQSKFTLANDSFPTDATGMVLLKATNRSKNSLKRVIGTTHSDNPLFDQKQFIIGDLSPNQSVTSQIFFRTRPFEIGGSSSLDIDFKEYGELDPFQTITKVVNFEESLVPKLVYSYEFKDLPKLSKPADLLSKSIALDIIISNNSSIGSGPITLVFKNGDPGNFSLDKGTLEINNILAHKKETKRINLIFKKIPEDKKYDLLASVIAADYPTMNLDKKISFDYGVRLKNLLFQMPEIKSNNPKIIDALNFQLTGSINDDVALKNIYIFQNGQKIFYTRLEPGKKTLDLDLALKFKDKGANNLLIIAEDNLGLRSQKLLRVAAPTK